jgi:enamine deaminase RidA (YjgF/YER057c/UK114 family)
MPREYVKGEWEQSLGFSPAVVTQGGKTIWLSGNTARVDKDGNSLADNFEAQVRGVFEKMKSRLERAGGTLQDLVQMTVFVKDGPDRSGFTEIRKQYFSDRYPASAMIIVPGFAHLDTMLEVQGIAVIGDE